MRTVRSPVASGKLLSVDSPPLPEGCALILARDIPGVNALPKTEAEATAHPILADGDILYAGQPVALLAGRDSAALERIMKDIKVEVAPLTEKTEPRIVSQREIEQDFRPQKKRKEAEESSSTFTIIENRYTTPPALHNASECTGAVAIFEGGSCVVHVATQWQSHVKRAISAMLAIEDENVRIVEETRGVHFDAKVWYPSLIAAEAALAAFVLKEPVKFILQREEERLYSPQRAKTSITLKSKINEKGAVLETEADVTLDMGASAFFADEMLDNVLLGALGQYKLGSIKARARAVESGGVPAGPFAGFGLSMGFFAIERHVAHIAKAAGCSPLEWKKSYILEKHITLPIGASVKKTLPFCQALSVVSERSSFGRKWASYELSNGGAQKEDDGLPVRGIGISAAYQGAGLLHHIGSNPYPALRVERGADAALIKCAELAEFEFLSETWKAIASSKTALGSARYDSSVSAPGDDPATFSAYLSFVTRLVEEAAEGVGEAVYKEEPIKDWRGGTIDQKPLSYPAICAAVIEVEIDKIEYKPIVRGIWLCAECGALLSKKDASRIFMIGGAAALAWAQGKKEPPNIKDLPNIDIEFIDGPASPPAGFDELVFSVIPAAYASAVSQALGKPFNSLPVGSRDVWAGFKAKDTIVV